MVFLYPWWLRFNSQWPIVALSRLVGYVGQVAAHGGTDVRRPSTAACPSRLQYRRREAAGSARMRLKLAIIGAGAAGLCCARHFSRFPEKFHVQVFEQASEVGGTWVYSENAETDEMGLPIHSSVYKNLRVNTPKEIMPFPGFPFDPNLPSYPYHWDVLDYLRKYTAHYNLSQFIRFRTRVEHVGLKSAPDVETAPIDGNIRAKWKVTTQDLVSSERTTTEYDAVLVCNGHFFKPFIPTNITGLEEFPGAVVHSHSYRQPASFKGLNILVVGAGLSGQDIMLDLANHANTVYLCNWGSKISCKLPENIEQLPAISSVRGDGMVCFVNQEKRKVDSIILCTGYEYEFPFLAKEAGIRVENNRIISLYKHTFNALHPSMAIIGMTYPVLTWPLIDLQVQWVNSVWSGDKELPSIADMCRDSEEDYQQRLDRGIPPHFAHSLEGDLQWEFRKEIAQMAGISPQPPVLQSLFEETFDKKRLQDLVNYKNREYEIVAQDKWIEKEY